MIEEEENVKKVWRYFILLVVLSALLCMSVFAAEELPVFTAEDGVAVEATEMQADKFTLTYTKTGLSGECLVLMITQEEAAPASEEPQYTITENTIQYVNQDAAAEGKISFTIYPKEMVNGVILLASQSGIEKLGTVSAPKEPAPQVTVEIMGSTTMDDCYNTATVVVEGNTLTIANESEQCEVLYSEDDGATYQKLAETAENVYDISKIAGAKIVVAVKGDVSGDGRVTAEDLTVLARSVGRIEAISDPVMQALAELTGDSVVTAPDLTELARYVGRIITSW